ncbi:MAG: hypothetical protein JWQ62_1320 [Lacunisphaera sp.]|nr:hypothetical protein [Lacunisphaera sp.]
MKSNFQITLVLCALLAMVAGHLGFRNQDLETQNGRLTAEIRRLNSEARATGVNYDKVVALYTQSRAREADLTTQMQNAGLLPKKIYRPDEDPH